MTPTSTRRRLRFVFGRLGVFPPGGVPRVVVAGDREGARELGGTGATGEGAARPVALRLEERPAQRASHVGALAKCPASDRQRWPSPGSTGGDRAARIGHVTLYHSRLSSSGPTYTALCGVLP